MINDAIFVIIACIHLYNYNKVKVRSEKNPSDFFIIKDLRGDWLPSPPVSGHTHNLEPERFTHDTQLSTTINMNLYRKLQILHQ